jgi:hypothetical protein
LRILGLELDSSVHVKVIPTPTPSYSTALSGGQLTLDMTYWRKREFSPTTDGSQENESNQFVIEELGF